MALNFPPVNAADGNPTNGMIWTSPEGRQWKYDSTIPGWRSLAPTGNSNIVYRGGLDLTVDPNIQYNDIEAGNQFVVVVGADPVDGTLYPGLGGQTVQEGAIALYDGNEWQVTSNIPYATEDVPGIVELADENEAIADPLAGRVVMTPERTGELIDVKVPQATTDVVGKTRYATKAEADAGTHMQAALTPFSIGNILSRLHRLEYNIVDSGMVMWMAAAKEHIPAGWIHCDGRRIYPQGDTLELYNKLRLWGNPWGNSPSSDVVNVPDLRGRFIRGYSDGTGRDPANTQFGGSQNDSFESHNHNVTVNDPGHTHTIEGYKFRDGANRSTEQVIVDDDYDINQRETDRQAAIERQTGISVNVQNRGGLETKPKNINLTPVIKL